MEPHKSDGSTGGKMADDHAAEAAVGFDDPTEGDDELVATAATVVVVGAGVIIFEAALLPGLVLGIATMLVPKYLPKLGGAVSPMLKSTVRGAYRMGQKTREMVAEVHEQANNRPSLHLREQSSSMKNRKREICTSGTVIVAEAEAEGDKKAAAPKSPARSSKPAA